MYRVNLPFSKQLYVNLLISLAFCTICVFLMFMGSFIVDRTDKIDMIRQQEVFVANVLEQAIQRDTIQVISDIVRNQSNQIELPSSISFVQWEQLTPKADTFTQYDNGLWSMNMATLKKYQNNLANTPNTEKDFLVYCNNECFIIVRREFVVLNHQGIATLGIRMSAFRDVTATVNNYPKIYLPINNVGTNWLHENISRTQFKSINIMNQHNQNLPIFPLSRDDYEDNVTFNDLLTSIAIDHNLPAPVIHPINFRNTHTAGYIVTFPKELSFWNTISVGIFNNFFLTLCAMSLLVVMICFQVFTSIRFFRFLSHNSERIEKYAKLDKAVPATDENYQLIQYLAKSFQSNEERDAQIAQLHNSMAMYSNYDVTSGLPNTEWLKEQLSRKQSELRIDASKTSYLIEFSLASKDNTVSFADMDIARALVKEIKAQLTSNDDLTSADVGIFNIITTSCVDQHEVFALLDKIKDHFNNNHSEHGPWQVNAGILRIYSTTISSDNLIEKVHLAFNASKQPEHEPQSYVVFSDNLQQTKLADSIFEARMRRAKLTGDIDVTFDVIYSLQTNQVDFIRATPVWYKDNNISSLEDYTDALIGCGINIEFGYWKIERCLICLKELDQETDVHCNVIIPLNYSQLVDQNLLTYLDVITVKHQILASRIFFNIDADLLSSDLTSAFGAMKALATAGYGIHLSYLGSSYFNTDFMNNHNIPVATVSGALVNRITASEFDRQMFTEIMKNVLKQNFKVICEGADDLIIIKALSMIGITLVTGRQFPQHKSSAELLRLIRNNAIKINLQ